MWLLLRRPKGMSFIPVKEQKTDKRNDFFRHNCEPLSLLASLTDKSVWLRQLHLPTLTTDRNCTSRVPTQPSGASTVHLSVSSPQQVFYCSHDFASRKFHELPESWKFRGRFISHGAFLLSPEVNAPVLNSNSQPPKWCCGDLQPWNCCYCYES